MKTSQLKWWGVPKTGQQQASVKTRVRNQNILKQKTSNAS
jgi:hypothetical protein